MVVDEVGATNLALRGDSTAPEQGCCAPADVDNREPTGPDSVVWMGVEALYARMMLF